MSIALNAISNLQRLKKLSWKALLSLCIAVIVFGYLFFRGYQGILLLIETGVHFSIGSLFLSFLCYLIGVLIASAVWADILKRVGVDASYLFHIQAFGISTLARKIPGIVWYAVSRIAVYEQRGIPRRPILIGLLTEVITFSLSGLCAFAIWVGTDAMNLPWFRQYLHFGPLQTAAGLLILICGIAWTQPWLIRRFTPRDHGVDGQNNEEVVASSLPISTPTPIHFGDSIRWLIGDTLVVGLASGVIYFLFQAIEPGEAMTVSPIPYVIILGSFGLSVALGPLSMWAPGDIGVKDGLIYLAISPLLGGPIAAVFVLVSRLWVTSLEILFGLVCTLGFGRSIFFLQKPQTNKKEA